jgi:hypothetical protein
MLSKLESRRVARGVFLFCAALSSAVAIRAEALERPPAAGTEWEVAADSPWNEGLYVIGDSISFMVPYTETARALGEKVWQRAGFGWSTYAHRNKLWGASALSSFEDAARSPASVVFVELGTNDTACMRAGGWCGSDFPATPDAVNAERWRMLGEMLAGSQRLIDAGKCVLWAGPREIERPDSSSEEPRAFNQMLRSMQSAFPGRFFYVDYNQYTIDNQALHDSLDNVPGADRIHPATNEGRQAIANLAFWLARAWCHL